MKLLCVTLPPSTPLERPTESVLLRLLGSLRSLLRLLLLFPLLLILLLLPASEQVREGIAIAALGLLVHPALGVRR